MRPADVHSPAVPVVSLEPSHDNDLPRNEPSRKVLSIFNVGLGQHRLPVCHPRHDNCHLVGPHYLGALLNDMSIIKDVTPPPTYRWYCKPKTLAFLFTGNIFAFLTMRNCYMSMGFLGIVFSLPSMMFGMGILLPGSCPPWCLPSWLSACWSPPRPQW